MSFWIGLSMAAAFGAFAIWWLLQPIHYRNVTRGDLADHLSRLLLYSLPGSWMSVRTDPAVLRLELKRSSPEVVEMQARFIASMPNLDSLVKFLADRGSGCAVPSGEELLFRFARTTAVSDARETVVLILEFLGVGAYESVDVRMDCRVDPESLRVAFDAFQKESPIPALRGFGKFGNKVLDRCRELQKRGRKAS